MSGTLYDNPWINFHDENGTGWARPDFFLLREDSLILFECKLSQTSVAESQVLQLYIPLLREIFALPIAAVQVCKNLREPIGPGLEVALGSKLIPSASSVYTWHWIGG